MVLKKKNQKTEDILPDNPARRSFLNKLWLGLGIFAIVEFIVLVIAYLLPGRKAPDKSETLIINAGNVDTFLNNSVTAFVIGKFYLCRMEDGGFIALSSKCTHLGCALPWQDKEKRFACPCHGSVFDISGEVINPPAPRPMDSYRMYIENSVVKVDTGRIVKRSRSLRKHLVYAKKAAK